MMMAGPGLAHPAAHHGLERALDPDARVDVDDQGDDGEKGEVGVAHRGQPAQGDRHFFTDQGLPHQHAADQQQRYAQQHDPVHQLLAGVVLAHRRQFLVAIGQHVVDLLEPLHVVTLEQALLEEADRHQHEQQRHEQADPRMQDTGHGGAAEQPGQRPEEGVKEGQPAEHQQYEADGDEPVQQACPDAVAQQLRIRLGQAHGRSSRSSRSSLASRSLWRASSSRTACSSSSPCSLGPAVA